MEQESSHELVENAKEITQRIISGLGAENLFAGSEIQAAEGRAVIEFQKIDRASNEIPREAQESLGIFWDVANESSEKGLGIQIAVLIKVAQILLQSGRIDDFIEELSSALEDLEQANLEEYKSIQQQIEELIALFSSET